MTENGSSLTPPPRSSGGRRIMIMIIIIISIRIVAAVTWLSVTFSDAEPQGESMLKAPVFSPA